MNNYYEHEKRLRIWLRKEGINPKYLSDSDIQTEFLIAQMEATKCLTKYFFHLEADEKQTFIKYLKKFKSKKTREKMHIKAAHTVMNLASKVRRRISRSAKKFYRTQCA